MKALRIWSVFVTVHSMQLPVPPHAVNRWTHAARGVITLAYVKLAAAQLCTVVLSQIQPGLVIWKLLCGNKCQFPPGERVTNGEADVRHLSLLLYGLRTLRTLSALLECCFIGAFMLARDTISEKGVYSFQQHITTSMYF